MSFSNAIECRAISIAIVSINLDFKYIDAIKNTSKSFDKYLAIMLGKL